MGDYKIYSLIVAGGKGLRMGSKLAKQYLDLEGKPILARTIEVFDNLDIVDQIIVVVPENDIEFCKTNIIAPFDFNKNIYMKAGGIHRQDSVFKGLAFIQEKFAAKENSIVLIHDGVRPFVEPKTIEQCIEQAVKHGACIPAVQVCDTIKQSDAKSYIKNTIDRKDLFFAQTPQVFKLDLIIKAYEYAQKKETLFTDDASLIEMTGQKVYIIQGSKNNIKITTPDDLDFSKFLLSKD